MAIALWIEAEDRVTVGRPPRAESHDPPLQFLERFVEAAFLGPVALGNRIGEDERQRIAVIGRGKAAPPHVVLALERRSRSQPDI